MTELILQHQNPQQLSANLWAAVRARGCQFLGPAMQEEVLKLVLLALEDGSALSRKVEGHFKGTQLIFCQGACDVCGPEVGTSLSSSKQDFHRPCSSASLSSQLLQGDEARRGQLIDATERRVPYVRHPAPRTRHPDRADCHRGRSKDCSRPVEQSSLWGLCSQIPHAGTEFKFSNILFIHSSFQSIMDKLQTPQSFGQSVQELVIALQRTGDPGGLASLRSQLDCLTGIDPSPESEPPPWNQVTGSLLAAKAVVSG